MDVYEKNSGKIIQNKKGIRPQEQDGALSVSVSRCHPYATRFDEA